MAKSNLGHLSLALMACFTDLANAVMLDVFAGNEALYFKALKPSGRISATNEPLRLARALSIQLARPVFRTRSRV